MVFHKKDGDVQSSDGGAYDVGGALNGGGEGAFKGGATSNGGKALDQSDSAIMTCFRSVLKGFMSTTTAHGFAHIANAKMKHHKLAWTVIVLGDFYSHKYVGHAG